MPASALRERLASLGQTRFVSSPEPGPEVFLPTGFAAIENELGVTYRRITVHPVLRPEGMPERLSFGYLDTETTGLSGGAGTQVFAAAFCRPSPDGLLLSQYFLGRPASEAAFLSALQAELREVDGIATYNGARFDLPLLRSRWVMARLPGALEHPQHVDLLTLTRALLRQRLASCTLHAVEQGILGLERDDDLPGALVPEAWFGYLRWGWSPTLEAALAHNRQDVLSLYQLHARLLLRLAGRDPGMDAADWLALGRHLWRRQRRADAWRALRRSAEIAQGPASAMSAILLARQLARSGRPDVAERLLANLAERLPWEAQLQVARARLLEWKLAQPGRAHQVVISTLQRLPRQSPHRADLEARLLRLERRLSRTRAAAGRGRRPGAPDFSAPDGLSGEWGLTLEPPRLPRQ